MDPQTIRIAMITKLLYTTGDGSFKEMDWEVPELLSNEIMVKAIMTGVCRSDIDMMTGGFGPLPINMSGHEGIGQVIEIGADIVDVSVGDYVATRGEPAYASVYPVRKDEFVVIPQADPKYIVEPVACGINLIRQAQYEIEKHSGDILILGSGFLAWVAYNTLKLDKFKNNITVVGRSNKDLWGDILVPTIPDKKFEIVIDLSSGTDIFDKDILANQALIIFGAQKEVTTNFANLLWKACTMVFPSPRNPEFIWHMKKAVYWIESGQLDVDKFWTKCYNRNTEWQQAFDDGLNRPSGYSRGYIKWDSTE
jgi:threonine dehydrogenase-like Zn-dependent dehydrogenase